MLVRPWGGGSACPSDSQDTDRRKGRRREKRAFPYLAALCPHRLSSLSCDCLSCVLTTETYNSEQTVTLHLQEAQVQQLQSHRLEPY